MVIKNDQEPRGTGVFRILKSCLDRSRIGQLLVMKGRISGADLRFALATQKNTGQPLGRILMQQKAISRSELMFFLARQALLRFGLTALLCALSLLSLSGKRAKADMIRDIPAEISMMIPAAAQPLAHITSYPALFGSVEKRSSDLQAFTKWTGMFKRFEDSMKQAASRQIMQKWTENLKGFETLPLAGMAEKVNAFINEKPYIIDNKNWGQSDYWATPVEFVQRGGDCEDFAIAKYTALRLLGVPEDRLRVAIVHDRQKNIPHAVLVLYTDDGALILDNQNEHVIRAEEFGRYRPIFSINRQAWWLHTGDQGTQLASVR